MFKLLDRPTQLAAMIVRFGKRTLEVGSSKAGGMACEILHVSEFALQPKDDFVAAAYFAAGTDSIYQLEQWLWPFERLSARLVEDGHGDHPLGIITRDIRCARRLRARTNIPVRFSRMTSGFEDFMALRRLKLVFYVNQATGNFQALKFPRPAHVHLNHGESEKVSMISNQLKAYDYVFTAGQAARERISLQLIGMDEKRMVDVGRPQLDHPRSVPQEWREFEATTPPDPIVFYVPTWEGDSPAMAYGTLAHNGERFVRTLLGAGYRVIFRPHPRTGHLDPEFAKARTAVEDIIVADTRGFVDESSDVSWQLDVADVALAEMSSVAFDWLSTLKPLVMIAPHDPGAEVLAGGLFDQCPAVEPGKEDRLQELIRDATEAWPSANQLSAHYLGDTAPMAQIERFIEASCAVIGARTTALSSGTGPAAPAQSPDGE